MGYSADKPTEALSRFAAELTYEDIPPEVIESMKLNILDTLGCGLLGSKDQRNSPLVESLRKLGGTPTSTVWGNDLVTSPTNAALANGTYVHAFDFDDQCQDVALHAGACAVPAALAFAEYRRGITGRQFLVACVAGYEVAMRVGNSIGLQPLKKGWHPAGFNGTFAAAAAVGKLMGLDARKMMHALGLAATQGAGLMSVQYGSDAKGMNCGKASQSGVYAAILAELGFRGITDVLELPYGGYASTLAETPDLGKITIGLGTEYLTLEKLALKAYPGVRWVHAPLEAVEEIVARTRVTPESIRRIIVKETSLGLDHVGWEFKPEGVTSALCNIAFGIALLLVRGGNNPILYNMSSINDPEILSVSRKVVVELDEEREKNIPESMGATVRIETRSGEILTATVDQPKGTPGIRPMSKAEVEQKFRGLVGQEELADIVIDVVYGLEEVKDCAVLAAALGSQSVQSAPEIRDPSWRRPGSSTYREPPSGEV